MTPDKATALREAAERATPGAWYEWEDEGEHYVCVRHEGKSRGLITMPEHGRDAAYIALADPPTILALLAERERLMKERDDADKTVHDLISTYPGGWCPPAPLMVRAATSIARQALEATDDQ